MRKYERLDFFSFVTCSELVARHNKYLEHLALVLEIAQQVSELFPAVANQALAVVQD